MAKMDLVIEQMHIAELDPAPYNPRTISPDALAGLRHSVERFGLVEPIVWNRRTGRVVGGHGRTIVTSVAKTIGISVSLQGVWCRDAVIAEISYEVFI